MNYSFHDIKQNEDEWIWLRSQKPTSSSLNKIMAHYGKPFGEPAHTYAINIAIEKLTGRAVTGSYKNADMDRGHEEEPLAVMEYEKQFFCDVTNGGFFDWGYFGCSPDGLVNDDGVIEAKSAIPSVHFSRIRKQSFDTTYKWQLLGNMKFTERKWIDFISYCGAFPEGKKIYVHRLYAKNYSKEFDQIDKRLEEFESLITEKRELILENKYFIDSQEAA